MAPRQHCTEHPVLSPPEVEFLINAFVECAKESDFARPPRTRLDWDAIVTRFNARFGGPKRRKQVLVCGISGLKKTFISALVTAYREWIAEKNAVKAKSDSSGGV